jgi:hypothetical protein
VERFGIQWAIGLNVPQEEILNVRRSLEGNPGSLPDLAVGPIAANQVHRADGLESTISVSERGRHPVIFGLEVDQFDAPLDAHAACFEVGSQDPFRLCLRQEEDVWEAGVGGAKTAQNNLRHVPVQMEQESRAASTGGSELVTDAYALQKLESTSLYGERTRFAAAVGKAVDDTEGDTERLKLHRQRETGGPGADDEHGQRPSRSLSSIRMHQ